MRFIIYALIIFAAVVIAWHLPTPAPTVNNSIVTTPIPTPAIPEDIATSTVTVKTELTKKIPKIAQSKPIDIQTLKQIQIKLNQTTQALNDLKKQSSSPLPSNSSGQIKIRLTQQELYNKAATRVVNFFCQQGNNIKVASGAIISPTGYILTNAHVAEGFSKDYLCAIRQGSPARNLGYAQIVMFPQAYVLATDRQGQAENDVSIWKLVKPAGPDPLPQGFPYYSIDPNLYPQQNQDLVTFSYPSELLGYETILKSLNMFFAETTVMDFDRDLIVSSSGLSSQVGSSGGVLVDPYTNELAGIIFGVSKDETINQRKLFSLTPYSVDRVVKAETGLDLPIFLSK